MPSGTAVCRHFQTCVVGPALLASNPSIVVTVVSLSAQQGLLHRFVIATHPVSGPQPHSGTEVASSCSTTKVLDEQPLQRIHEQCVPHCRPYASSAAETLPSLPSMHACAHEMQVQLKSGYAHAVSF